MNSSRPYGQWTPATGVCNTRVRCVGTSTLSRSRVVHAGGCLSAHTICGVGNRKNTKHPRPIVVVNSNCENRFLAREGYKRHDNNVDTPCPRDLSWLGLTSRYPGWLAVLLGVEETHERWVFLIPFLRFLFKVKWDLTIRMTSKLRLCVIQGVWQKNRSCHFFFKNSALVTSLTNALNWEICRNCTFCFFSQIKVML